MNEEFAEFADAAQQANEIQEGQIAAINCMIDTLIAVLVKALPPLADSIEQHIGMCSDHYQEKLQGAPLALRALDSRLAEVRGLLEALR